MISIQDAVYLMFYVIGAACIYGVLYWVIQSVLPFSEQVKKWLLIFLQILGAIFVIGFILQIMGYPIVRFR